MNISITGTIDCRTMPQLRAVYRGLSKLDAKRIDSIATGGAYGVDTHAALFCYRLFPEAEHNIFFPIDKWWNSELLNLQLWDHVTGVGGGYMKRNDALVDFCDELIAFPKTSEEELRSGTWATIRRSQKAGKRVHLFALDGSSPLVTL